MIRSINETKRKMVFLFILIFTAIIFLNSNLQKECMCVSLLFYGTLWKLHCRIPFNQHVIGAIWSVINQLPNLASCDNSWMCFNLCTSNTQTHIRIRLGSCCFLRWCFTVLNTLYIKIAVNVIWSRTWNWLPQKYKIMADILVSKIFVPLSH